MTDIHTLSGAYALDAVNDIERAAFTRHLRECPACAQEVAELAETAGRLASDAVTAPPARLRSQVLDEISRTRQVGPQHVGPSGVPGRWRRWTAASVAAAAVIGAVAAGGIVQEQRVRDAQRHSTQAARVEAVLAAPDAVVHTAAGPDGAGRVTLVVSESRNEAVAVIGGLPSPGVDRTYQLWMVDAGQATAAGTLGTDVAGGTVLVEGVRDKQAFAITNEPAGGSPAPTPPQLVTIGLS
ncbi:MAG TPA: anti-sigma factor [Micromonosporaceae bacterium]|jgi:anti-sigma-K factor RskA|nr:anti-sigma factor [Micromonosporaceae bacterium]